MCIITINILSTAQIYLISTTHIRERERENVGYQSVHRVLLEYYYDRNQNVGPCFSSSISVPSKYSQINFLFFQMMIDHYSLSLSNILIRILSFLVLHLQLINSSHTKVCATKTMLTVNGEFPGPTIYARRGDLVIVDIINRADQNITIHW